MVQVIDIYKVIAVEDYYIGQVNRKVEQREF